MWPLMPCVMRSTSTHPGQLYRPRRNQPMTFQCLLSTALLTLVPAGAYADEAEEKAVAAVNKLGGRVYPVDRKPGQPVVAVEFYDKRLNKGDLKVLAAFKQIEGLHLHYSTLPDAELAELA